MKSFVYTTKDEDGIYGMLAMTSHKHFMAEQIQAFFKKVGQWKPVKWVILGEYDNMSGKLLPYENEEEFDWEKQLADDMLVSNGSSGVETSSIAREVENEE